MQRFSQEGTGRPPRLVLRVAVSTAIVVLLLGGALLWLLRHESIINTEKQVGMHARYVADVVLRHGLFPTDFHGPVSGGRRAELDELFRRGVLVEGTLRAKVYDAGGRVVYSNDHSLIGSVSDEDSLRAALGGETALETSRINHEGGVGENVKVLETYVPLRLAAGAAPVGALELYDDYEPVAADVRGDFLRVAGALVLGLIALYVSLFPILRRAAATLEARSRRLREQAEVLENASDLVFTLDRDGRFTSVNRAAEEVTGYERPELLGMTLAELLLPEDRKRVSEASGAIWGADATFEAEIVTKSGGRAVLEVSARPIERDGKPAGVQGIARDATERRRLEKQLRHSQKMEAVGQLAEGVAHDFNNLLTAIQGHAEFLRDDLDAEGPLRRSADEIYAAAGRAGALTRQLLAFSRRELVRPRVVDLNDLVGGVAGLLRRTLGEDVELRSVAAPEPLRVYADAGLLEQVLVSLAVNARDAMATGGRLTIETRRVLVDEAGARRQGDVEPGPYACLVVSDSGRGMSEEVRARAFEPFFTTKERGRGTGLGLATVYGIVKQAGGYVLLHSEEGTGTTVEVYLPVSAGEVGSSNGAAEAAPSGGRESVLVVEDEQAVRDFVSRVLTRAGYAVVAAGSGNEALALPEAGNGLDLLLTDVVLPGLSGRELAERLTALRPDLRVLFMSGYTDDVIVRHGVLEEGAAFLEKPFGAEELLRRVRQALEGAAGPPPAVDAVA